MGGCQNHGPFLDTLNSRCRIIIGIKKGTIILTTIHILIFFKGLSGPTQMREWKTKWQPLFRAPRAEKKMGATTIWGCKGLGFRAIRGYYRDPFLYSLQTTTRFRVSGILNLKP